MSVNEYILSEEQIQSMHKPRRPRKRTVKQAVRYQVLEQSGCDFVVEKKQGSATEKLVVLVSQVQYYIDKGSEKKPLTVPRLRGFLSEMEEELSLPEVTWITSLSNDELMIGEMMSSLRSEEALPFLRNGNYYVYSGRELEMRGFKEYLYEDDYFVSEEFVMPNNNLEGWIIDYLARRRGITKKAFFQEIMGMPEGEKEGMLFQSLGWIRTIRDEFGLEWARKAVECYMDSTIESDIDKHLFERILDLPGSFDPALFEGDSDQIEPRRCFQPQKLLDYLFGESARQGYLFHMDSFLNEWKYCLRGQELLYGKIREKYPKQLASYVRRISFELSIHKKEVMGKEWERAVEKMLPYEYEGEKYKIICPKGDADMQKEGMQQHNCVATYAGKVRRGEDMIFFMRDCDQEEESLVTIEVCLGSIQQICRAFNEGASDEEMAFISEWAAQNGLSFPDWDIRHAMDEPIFDFEDEAEEYQFDENYQDEV